MEDDQARERDLRKFAVRTFCPTSQPLHYYSATTRYYKGSVSAAKKGSGHCEPNAVIFVLQQPYD